MFKLCLYGLLYDGLMGMSMHDREGIICGGLWAWHDSHMSCTWEVWYIYMCVWSRIWHEQWLLTQWHGIGMRGSILLMIGNDELVLI